LSERLKSDSAVDLTGEAGVSQESSTGNRKKAASLDALVLKLDKAATAMTTNFESKQRQQPQQRQDDNRDVWQEYFSVSEKFLELVGQPNKLALLVNMSIRVRYLEKVLNIDQSVTIGVDGIPPVLQVVTLATKDSTSEVTKE
jgi:hypothetical protein